jgi:hypothetical protein
MSKLKCCIGSPIISVEADHWRLWLIDLIAMLILAGFSFVALDV